jgi:hypothetical protein
VNIAACSHDKVSFGQGLRMHEYARCNCCGSLGITRRALIAGGAAAAVGLAMPRADAAAPPSLDEWVRVRPNIAQAITWDFGKGPQPYASWPDPFKARLRSAYARAWNNEPSGLVDPPPNQLARKDDEFPNTVLTLDHAFALHAALVGNSLAIEIGHRVPWSIADYAAPALAALFDASPWIRRKVADGYEIWLNGVPAPPETSLAFLRAKKLVDANRRATIVRLLEWCAFRMSHFAGNQSAGNFEAHWQYRGMPPVSRVIGGTRYDGSVASQKGSARYYTAGCWGTTATLAAVLRTVNIPVAQVFPQHMSPHRGFESRVERHSAPHFISEDLYLSHGDDPYNAQLRLQPSFDVAEILIDKAQYEAWFPPGVTPVTGTPRNVGRRVVELSARHLPIYTLNQHVQDMLAKSGRAAGKVYGGFRPYYTVAELEAMRLWERLDAKVAQLGGGQKVRELYAEAERRHRDGGVPDSMK